VFTLDRILAPVYEWREVHGSIFLKKNSDFELQISGVGNYLIPSELLTFLASPCCKARGHRDRKKRPGVDFFFKASSAGLTNLHNQEHVGKVHYAL
jgi:hypothetical protein